MSEIRSSFLESSPLTDGFSDIRISYTFSEVTISGLSPEVRVTHILLDDLLGGYSPQVRVSYFFAEYLQAIIPEGPVSTEKFPGFGNSISNPTIPAAKDPFNTPLPGLTFSVHKIPMFRTKVSEAASGFELTNALMEYPKWTFELTYEFLEDRSGAASSLKTIVGFFLNRKGRFDTWLFKDPDDYEADNSICGLSDGLTTEFPLTRTYGGFIERIGQVDEDNSIEVYRSVEEADTIPATPGPYTITVINAADYIEDLGVTKGGISMTSVPGVPSAGQYSVDEVTGIYTFNATDQLDAVVISYRYLVATADYTVTLPNRLIFDVAPEEGTISWSGQFFFVCRFIDDEQDYEKFAEELWTLQQCNFRSQVQ